MRKRKLFILLLAAHVCLTACSSHNSRGMVGSIIAGAADTQVGYSDHECFAIKSRCVGGHYEEWKTSEGKPGCSCKDYSQ